MSFRSPRALFTFAITLSISGFSWANDIYCTDLMDKELNPLGQYQWHLYSHGDSSYATPLTASQSKTSYGHDINAYYVLRDYCLSGKGINVAVVDSGMQITHPSLAPNIDNRPYKSATWSVNFRNNRLPVNDPSPIDADEEDHGTMVAGIIGMRSNLGFGGSGVAPRANLASYNIINEDTQKFQYFYESLGGADFSKNTDIFNMSYGLNNTSQVSLDEPLQQASLSMYRTGTRLMRNGKGAIYVKAGGNGFDSLGRDDKSCKTAIEYGVSCQNALMDPDTAVPEVITVGALNIYGKKTTYSTTGASLWISMPGGEYGYDTQWLTSELARFNKFINWNRYGSGFGEPAIVSTDMMGPLVGVSRQIDMDSIDEILQARNPFNAGLVLENKNFNYTNSMNGTSAATPMASGAIAVILETNPNLSWRDVKYILAKTSTKVDPTFKGVTADLPNGKFQLEQGWVTNAAGYNFSNWYGFGRVDLRAAVDFAYAYNFPLGQYIEKAWLPKGKKLSLDVPNGDYDGVKRVVNIPKNENLLIESVQILVSIESDYIGDLQIELTSPSGTKSIVWHAANGFANNGNLEDMIMQTNAFYGENSAGDWTVRLVNTGIHKADATWTAFQIKITGYEG